MPQSENNELAIANLVVHEIMYADQVQAAHTTRACGFNVSHPSRTRGLQYAALRMYGATAMTNISSLRWTYTIECGKRLGNTRRVPCFSGHPISGNSQRFGFRALRMTARMCTESPLTVKKTAYGNRGCNVLRTPDTISGYSNGGCSKQTTTTADRALTLEVSGGRKLAKPAFGRPLDRLARRRRLWTA